MRLWKPSPPLAIAFEAFGVTMRVALDDPALQDQIEAVLPPSRNPCDPSMANGLFSLRASEPAGFTVTVAGAPWVEQAELDVALAVLDAQIRMFLATHAPDLIFVHAGAVALDGKGFLFPGESFAGKTTLVAALVQAGATYFSDEYAVLDFEGRLYPYARRLSIRNGGATPQERSVRELGGVAASDPAAVSGVVITRYRPGTEWHPKHVSPGEGVLALLANTVPAQVRPRESLRAVSRAVGGATVLEGDRGEARELAPLLLHELAAMSP